MTGSPPMLDELFKGFKSAKAFIAYGPQLTRMVRFALANPAIYLGDNAQRIDPNLDQEQPNPPPNLDEPQLEVPDIDENDIRASELNFSATTQGSGNKGGAEQGAGEGTSRPGGRGATIPVVTEEVERGEKERQDERGEREQKQQEDPNIGGELGGDGGQDERMHSPPLTPGHGSNNDDPDLASLDRIVARLKARMVRQREEARLASPAQVLALREQLRVEQERRALLEQQKSDIEDACIHAETQASRFSLENEQLKVIADANSEALIKSKEECRRLTEELEKARADLMARSEEVHRKQFRIDNLERTIAQLKSELAAQETSLQETLDTIKNPIKTGTSKDVQDRLMEGAIAIRQVKSLQQQFQEWKDKVSECGARLST